MQQNKYFKLSSVPADKSQSDIVGLFADCNIVKANLRSGFAYIQLNAFSSRDEDKIKAKFGNNNIYAPWNSKLTEVTQTEFNNIPQIVEQPKGRFKWALDVPKCVKSKPVSIVCVTKDCQTSPYICQIDCECFIAHKKCKYANWDNLLEEIDTRMKSKTPETQKMINTIKEYFIEVKKSIQKQQINFNNWSQSFGLRVQQANFVANVRQNRFNFINGNIINRFFQNMNEVYNPITKSEDKLKEQYKQIMKLVEKLNSKLTTLYLERQQMILDRSAISNQSLIIHSFFEKKIKKLNLLYRASQNNFLASEFHKKCENISNTIVILENQFSKVIGGFTPVAWKSNQGYPEDDNIKQSFLFSISDQEKIPIINNKNAVYHYNSHGPAFGAGNDLFISDKANKVKSSYCNFPFSYNNKKYSSLTSEAARISFSGCDSTFIVKEWEVYHVEFY